MGILDIFKKKEMTTGTSSLISKGGINPPPETPRPEPPTPDKPLEDKPQKTLEELYEEWYSKLTPEVRKRVDQKMEKLIRKAGRPVCCKKCGKPGSNKTTGPLRKIKDDYFHQNCLPGEGNV